MSACMLVPTSVLLECKCVLFEGWEEIFVVVFVVR